MWRAILERGWGSFLGEGSLSELRVRLIAIYTRLPPRVSMKQFNAPRNGLQLKASRDDMQIVTEKGH